MSILKFIPLIRKRDAEVQNGDERLLRDYLENRSAVKYNDHALEGTVRDVTALDDDLKEYVMQFLKTRNEETDIGCECVSIRELLETKSFTPVTAALFVQWYRKDPANAAAYLLHHDAVRDIPQQLPECEEDSDGEEV